MSKDSEALYEFAHWLSEKGREAREELCDEIVWQKMVPERVNAILTPDSTGSKLILGHVQSYNDLSYRRRPASEILWAMVKANGKRTN